MKTFFKSLSNTLYHLTLVAVAVLGILYLGDFIPVTEKNNENDENQIVTVAETDTSTPNVDSSYTTVNTTSATPIVSDDTVSLENTILSTEDTFLEVSEDVESSPTTLFDKEVLSILSDSVVTATNGYQENFNKINGEVTVFAEEIENSFIFQASSWYNLWCENQQSVVYNAQKISNWGEIFAFDVGLASGKSSGTVKLSIIFDGEEIPEYEYILDAEAAPLHIELDLSTIGTTLKLMVDNLSSDSNTVVFHNLSLIPATEV